MVDAVTKGIKTHRARVAGPKAGALTHLPSQLVAAGCLASSAGADATPLPADKKKLADKKKRGLSVEKTNRKARAAARCWATLVAISHEPAAFA